MKGTGVVRRVDDFEKVVIPRRYAGICVFGKATPHVQHLHPRNNSKERSRISTYGAEIEDYANKIPRGKSTGYYVRLGKYAISTNP